MTMTAHPALVLNADFRPMSYFPLSLLSWQDAVRAVFSERVSIVAEYDTWARSPSTQIRLPSVVALRKYQRSARRVAFTRFNVFLRDRFTCQIVVRHSYLRHSRSSTWSRARGAARRHGPTSSRPACRATRARATHCGSNRDACRKSRRSTSCWQPSEHFHPAICMKAGWTTSTGTRSSRPSFVS
jgi:5-methylcytosine-specific restriction endonuclease McrA